MNNLNRSTAKGKVVLAFLVLALSSNALNAQTTPDKGHMNKSSTTTVQPPQQGWMWWDDASFKDMNIDADRSMELRAMDERYRTEYNKMGTTPWTNSGYQALTDRRNAEIKGVLSPEQYEQWTPRSSGNVNSSGGTLPATPKN